MALGVPQIPLGIWGLFMLGNPVTPDVGLKGAGGHLSTGLSKGGVPNLGV